MSETLKIFNKIFPEVKGFKAETINDNIQTYKDSFITGTVTYASSETISTSGKYLNLTLPFMPDMFVFFLSKDSFNSLSSYSNNRIFNLAFYKENIFVPIYGSATGGSENYKSVNGYIPFRGTAVASTSGNTSGYGVNGAWNPINTSTYTNWDILEVEGEIKIKVGKFSSSDIYLPAGTYYYAAWNFDGVTI